MDSKWSTVGSSNLDPLSLSFNLESNVFILDRAFNRYLRERLEVLIQNHCRQFKPEHIRRSTWQAAMSFLAFHFMRHFPVLAGWVPVHAARMETVSANTAAVAEACMAASPKHSDESGNDEDISRAAMKERRPQALHA